MNNQKSSTIVIAGLALGLVAYSAQVWAAGFSFKIAQKIVFEIEEGKISKPFKIVEESKASGGKVVYLKEKSNKIKKPGKEFYDGTIEFKFNVSKEAKYVVWLRKLWMDGCGNSIYMTIDKPISKDNVLVLGEDGTYDKFTWVKLNSDPLHLKKGVHTIVLQNREDGIKLDQIALIEFEKDRPKDDQYVPVTDEKSTKSLVN